jgi:hypothetical protein
MDAKYGDTHKMQMLGAMLSSFFAKSLFLLHGQLTYIVLFKF